MFCPNCAKENQEDIAYCRGCGEDLTIISQAMKKHLPITLVSKLDAVIEKKNERLRRDAVLLGLAGLLLLISSGFVPSGGSLFSFFNILCFLMGIFFIYGSGLNFLAYRRSLEIRKKPLNVSAKGESILSGDSQGEALPDETGAKTNKLVGVVKDAQVASTYCPRCGVQNLENLFYCRSCGTNLDFSSRPQGMERYLPVFVVNKLDATIAKNEEADYKPRYKSGRTVAIAAIMFLVNAISFGLIGEWGYALFWFALGVLLSITNGWDLIAHRRGLANEYNLSFSKEGKLFENSSRSAADDLIVFLIISWKWVGTIFAVFLIYFVLGYFEIATEMIGNLLPPIIIILLIILVGSYLKFKQNLNTGANKEYPDNTLELPTNELMSADTLPLASPSLSVSEDATISLVQMEKDTKKEKIQVSRKKTLPNS